MVRFTLFLLKVAEVQDRAISRDPVAYPDPDEFKPERFLVEGKPSPNVRDPRKYFFGFGRRSVS